MKLFRPYVPLEIRCIVAVRQCAERGINTLQVVNAPLGRRLKHLLILLFAGRKHDLHHRPALENRVFDKRKRIYIPDANDADYLVYIETHEHYIETHVRGRGAMRSDTAHRNHQKRLDENRGLRPRKPKAKIQSRGFASSDNMPRANRGFSITLDPKGTWEGLRFGKTSEPLPRASRKWWGSRSMPKQKMKSRMWR